MGSNFSSSIPDPYELRRVDVACEIFKHEPNVNLGASASIFNLPEIITTQKPEAYEPQEIGLGPNYHDRFRSNRKLEQMKFSAVRLVLQNKGIKNLNLVPNEVLKIVPNARSCYKEVQMMNDMILAWIFTVDGIYLLSLLYSYGPATDNIERESFQLPLNKDPYQHTILFKREVDSQRRLSVKDIMMEENQIPFMVLVEIDKALHLTSGSSTSTSGIEFLFSLFRSFCEIHSPLELCSTRQATFSIDHLLQFMYQSIIRNTNMDEKKDEVKNDDKREEVMKDEVKIDEKNVEKIDEKKKEVKNDEMKKDEEKVEKPDEVKEYEKKSEKVYEKKDGVRNDEMRKYEKRVEKTDEKKDQVKTFEVVKDEKNNEVKKYEIKAEKADEKKEEVKKDEKMDNLKKDAVRKDKKKDDDKKKEESKMPSWMYYYCEFLGNFPRNEMVELYKQTVANLETFSQSKPALPSASKLHDRAGYSFHLLPKDKGVWEIDIKGKDFYLPCLTLNNNSEVIFRNLVAYELFAPYTNNFPLGEYMGLMCGLINNVDDVKLLKKKNIIKCELHDNEVVQLFVGMSSSISSMKTRTKSHLQLKLEKVNMVYESSPRVKMIMLLKKLAYWVMVILTAFGGFAEVSWKIAVFVASVMAGFVLIRQAYCDVYDCNNSNVSLMPT